jgi:hypothetical protein
MRDRIGVFVPRGCAGGAVSTGVAQERRLVDSQPKPLTCAEIHNSMSEDQILRELRDHLIGRSLRNIEFYLTDNEDLMPLADGSLYTDGGVVFRLDNGEYFTFGFDMELELTNTWRSLPTGESEIELPEMGEDTVPAHLRQPIKDIEVMWEWVEDTEEGGVVNGSTRKLTLPIMIIFTLQDDVRFALASLAVEEDDQEGPMVGLDIEGYAALILEEDLIDFIVETDEDEDDDEE